MNAYDIYDTLIEYFSYEHLLNEVWGYFGTWKMEEAFRSIANTWDIPLEESDEQ